MIDCLGILAIAMRDRSKPSYMDEVNENFTKAEVILLDCIFEHYSSDGDSTYFENTPMPSQKTVGSEKDVTAGESTSDNSYES